MNFNPRAILIKDQRQAAAELAVLGCRIGLG